MRYKRPLTNAQIESCEKAEFPMCTCRCGGALHGKSHVTYGAVERGILAEKGELTEEDIQEAIKYALQQELR